MKRFRNIKLLKHLMYIVIGFIVLITSSAYYILNQPEFGKLPSDKRLEKIHNSKNYKDGSFQNQSESPNFTGNSNIFKVFIIS